MKAYLFSEGLIQRSEVILVPNVVYIDFTFRGIITEPFYVEKKLKGVLKAKERGRISGTSFIKYEREIEIPEPLVREVIGWKKSEDISRKAKRGYLEELSELLDKS